MEHSYGHSVLAICLFKVMSKHETRMLILMFQRFLMAQKWKGRLLEDR